MKRALFWGLGEPFRTVAALTNLSSDDRICSPSGERERAISERLCASAPDKAEFSRLSPYPTEAGISCEDEEPAEAEASGAVKTDRLAIASLKARPTMSAASFHAATRHAADA